MKAGVELIAEERQRQIEQRGWTAEHDDDHRRSELAIRLRQLAIAGALIAAEIDRLQRIGVNVRTRGDESSPPDLTFSDLRQANLRRLPVFKNRKGEPAHSEADGSDWCLAQWCNAVCGELGEAANLIKKIERGDVTLEEAGADLAKELADVATYLDILAFRAGVDLGKAVRLKFNEVSARVGCDVRL